MLIVIKIMNRDFQMKTLLKTDRLTIRNLGIEDAKKFFAYRSDPDANRYQGWLPKNEQDALNFIRFRITDTPNIPDTWIQLAIILSKDHKIIGDLGVYFHPDSLKDVKLGYTLDKEYWGHGYAYEALHALIDHLMRTYGKTRFTALISAENTASINLVTRLGFKRHEITDDPEILDKDYPDDLLYVLDLALD